MKFFKNKIVAIVIAAMVVLGTIGYGQLKAPAAVPEPTYNEWVYDGANMLSSETESVVNAYNARWDSAYQSA